MMEKARLAITLDKGKLKITKAKNYADPAINPNGMSIYYKLVNGINIMPDRRKSGWFYDTGEDGSIDMP